MKRNIVIALFLLPAILICTGNGPAKAAPTHDYSFWLGSHYTSFEDYNKKVGEYNLGNDELLPEFKGFYLYRSDGSLFRIDGHYYDNKNVEVTARGIRGDRAGGEVYYRSLVRQEGQDLLENINARERTGTTQGGKMLTHAVNDPGADYNTHRQEFGTKFEYLLSRKNNIKIMAAHRSILKKGEEQKILSTHCFSCHLESNAAKVDRQTHQFQAGIQGDIDKYTLGYEFGFRSFDSKAVELYGTYDEAKHPANGGSIAEFSSRLSYDDTTVVYGVYPETEKMSHKVRFKGDLGENGRFSSSLGYSRAKNKRSDLESDAWVGALNYSVLLSERVRLITTATGTRLTADDPFIDVPTYRDGMAGTNTSAAISDFDFTRYSSLDRADARISAELIMRLNKATTFSVLTGFNHIDRYDYPLPEYHYKTNQFYGQVKFRFRSGIKYNNMVKYRLELTSDPWRSFRGLFESPGREVLVPDVIGPTLFSYYQREKLRYQAVTNQPTKAHLFEFSSTYKPDLRHTVMLGVKGKYDKNDDLDSLDVKHYSVQPYLNLVASPSPKWSFVAGYTYGYFKSRGPVSIALFDG